MHMPKTSLLGCAALAFVAWNGSPFVPAGLDNGQGAAMQLSPSSNPMAAQAQAQAVALRSSR
jgi:hypothetical protein